jgi:hypothetical protein
VTASCGYPGTTLGSVVVSSNNALSPFAITLTASQMAACATSGQNVLVFTSAQAGAPVLFDNVAFTCTYPLLGPLSPVW